MNKIFNKFFLCEENLTAVLFNTNDTVKRILYIILY